MRNTIDINTILSDIKLYLQDPNNTPKEILYNAVNLLITYLDVYRYLTDFFVGYLSFKNNDIKTSKYFKIFIKRLIKEGLKAGNKIELEDKIVLYYDKDRKFLIIKNRLDGYDEYYVISLP